MKRFFCFLSAFLLFGFAARPFSSFAAQGKVQGSDSAFTPLHTAGCGTKLNDFCLSIEDPLFLSDAAPSGGTDSVPLAPVHLDVKPLAQDPLLPNGCEAVSMTMLLQYAGVKADPVDFAVDFIPRAEITKSGGVRFAPDPEQAYIGDPRSEHGGWYCFEGPVIEGANRLLRAGGIDGLSAQVLESASYYDLWCCLSSGCPAAVWMTTDYGAPRLSETVTFQLPDHSTLTPFANLHCVVLTGIENDRFYLADPLHGALSVSAEQFFSVFEAMGSRAVILAPNRGGQG